MATNYERGRAYEYKSMRLLEACGYETFRTAGSHGVFDVGGISGEHLILVQVKFGYNPTEAELEQFRLYKVPAGTSKVVHRWDYRKSQPIVTTL